MMRMRTKTTELTSMKGITSSPVSATRDGGDEEELEVRPGGMLVQKRDPNDVQTRVPPPTIRVRVKYRSIYHEMIISSQATFGELKKMLTGPTGLHHEDQKIIYKDKERNSKTFLDVVGVKDKSKMVVEEDAISKEKRYLEARKNAKIEKAVKLLSEITLEVDRLAGQLSALESVIGKGGKVAENMVANLIELLMNQLIKLDEIKIDGDVNSKKKKQVERVQKYVETLDVMKVKNTTNHIQKKPPPPVAQPAAKTNSHQPKREYSPKTVARQHQEPSSKNTSGAVVVTTQWETFDSLPTIFPAPPSTSTTTTTTTTINTHTLHPQFTWNLL
ncbi:hypothetical protein LXL04_021685 [Taraxacum kok-saghyz]